ncbi:MAG TPA: M12 family metallo-peptidase [Thermoanaerobaculia bacterium]|nr:M12 family metallo-peptidase [Thermoanaerobaculia bacterium]
MIRPGFPLATGVFLLSLLGSADPGAARAIDSPVARAGPPAVKSEATAGTPRELGVLLRSDALNELRSIRAEETVTVRSLPLDASESVDLELRRFDLFSDAARNVEAGEAGVETDAPLPDGAFYEGTVAGDPQSRVFLSAFRASVHAIVQRGADTFAIEPRGRWERETADHVVRRLSPEEWAALAGAWRCDAERMTAPATREALLTAVADTGQPFAAVVAVDTDYELFQRFGNAAKERNYVSNELAAVSAIYWRDLKTRLKIGFLRVWTTASDPWTATSPISALFQLGDYWHAHGSGTARSTVVFLSGKDLGGGVAWLSTICQGDQWDSADAHWAGGYAVVGNVEGSMTNFHSPPAGSDVWDVEAVAHELGHNFGSVHTHCYSPPIDECYGGEPGCYSGPNVDPGPGVGTIMSYCHLFGWSEISLKFHSRCISEQMRPTIVNAASSSPACMAAGGFTDISSSDGLAPSVYTVAAWGIMPGCTATTFCPAGLVTRADMAVFIERGLNAFVPPPGQPQIFSDVPPGSYAYDFIEDFSRRKITSGCGATTYCPTNGVTRAQMAILLLRAEHGSAYVPPAATGTMFSDVPASAFAAPWIEQLARESITLGCGGGMYCPNLSVPREQMAAFLVRTLHL